MSPIECERSSLKCIFGLEQGQKKTRLDEIQAGISCSNQVIEAIS